LETATKSIQKCAVLPGAIKSRKLSDFLRLNTTVDLPAIWQKDADALFPTIRWLPFWRPRIVLKNGYFSPWFWPFLWFAKTGAFNLFFFVIVSRELLDCPGEHRRAVLAHECGHLRGFHSLIWAAVGLLLRSNATVASWLSWVGNHHGPWMALGVFAGFLALSLAGCRALLYWFEHQADDYAVAKVGPQAVIGALSWLRATLYGQTAAPWMEARTRRLQRLHGLVEETQPDR
jgi:hypothetical protein